MTVSYWLDAPSTPRPPLDRDAAAEAVVIGAGMTGIALAYFLRRRGLQVIVLDHDTVAGGATGRNTGFIVSGLGEHYAGSVAFWGREQAEQITRLHLANHHLLREIVTEHQICCDYRCSGSLAIAMSDEEESILWESRALMREDGFPCELLGASETGRVTNGKDFRASLLKPSDGSVDPVRLVRGLADVAAGSGAEIFENTHVRCVYRDGEKWVVESNHGKVWTDLLFLASNAWTPYFLRSIPLEPVRGQCFAAGPLDRPLPEIPCTANYASEYWRGVARYAVFGGMRRIGGHAESGYRDAVTDGVQTALRDFCFRHFPDFEKYSVTHRWSGLMAYTPDGLPLVGEIPPEPGLFLSAGYTGHGFGSAFLAAEWLTELAIDGTDRIPILCRADREMRSSPALAEN